MFQSSLKEAQAFQDFYLPKTGSYYRDNRNYSYDFKNKRNTTSLLSPYIRYRLLSEEDIIKKTLSINSFTKTEKFIQEIYWRTYWKGWLEHRPEVYDDYLTQKNKLLQNLPKLVKDSYLANIKINTNQHFTKPPPRFSEPSLVKSLEEKGIGSI